MESLPTSSLPRDTTLDALRVQLAALRRMGETGRAELTADLSESLRQQVEAGVRHRHPYYDDRTARLAAMRVWLGDDLFRRAFPHARAEP